MSVKPERTPADEARRAGPGHPGGAPPAPRNPEPAVPGESPPPEMMGRPRPHIETNPRPTPRFVRSPVAVIIRPPLRPHRGVPDIAVRRVVLPRAVAIKGAAVYLQILRQIL